MLDAEKRSVSIVIQIHELPSPPHEHGKAGGQDDPHRRFQTLQPVSNRTQGGLRPVEHAYQCAHLAAARKNRVNRHCVNAAASFDGGFGCFGMLGVLLTRGKRVHRQRLLCLLFVLGLRWLARGPMLKSATLLVMNE